MRINWRGQRPDGRMSEPCASALFDAQEPLARDPLADRVHRDNKGNDAK